MTDWLTNNAATVMTVLSLCVVVVAVMVKMSKDRKSGKSGCSFDCDSCAMGNECMKNNKQRQGKQ